MKQFAVGVLAFGGLMLLYLLHPAAGVAAVSIGFAYALRRHICAMPRPQL